MAFDTVPWFVGGGAQHSAEVARLLAHAATRGSDGVVGAGDLKAMPLATPGGSVRISKGACVMPSRAAGGDQQTYIGRNISEEVVAVTPTGSGGGRTDLVIVRVEDPNNVGSGFPAPTDPTIGPYIYARTLAGVSSSVIASNAAARAYLSTQGITGIPLAGITLPASTGTVTSGMITDLRNLANPRSERNVQTRQLIWGTYLAANTNTVWPGGGPTVQIPTWATKCYAQVTLSGARAVNAYPVEGFLSIGITGTAHKTPDIKYRAEAPPTLIIMGTLNVAGIAGTAATFELQGRKTNQAENNGALLTDNSSAVTYDLHFIEETV